MRFQNKIEFLLTGDYALFSDPVSRIGGEKCSYQIPTYEAVKGVLASIYWKPTFIWFVDKIRVMKPIQTTVKGIRPIKYHENKNDLSFYTYLKDCAYQVSAHFEWNLNRSELEEDRNENKHFWKAQEMLKKGGRRDIFLGTRECQGYVEPCAFGEGTGAYDSISELSFGLMVHGITYADEAYDVETKGNMTLNLWYPVMKKGIIEFPRPENCLLHKPIRKMNMKSFSKERNNFTSLEDSQEE